MLNRKLLAGLVAVGLFVQAPVVFADPVENAGVSDPSRSCISAEKAGESGQKLVPTGDAEADRAIVSRLQAALESGENRAETKISNLKFDEAKVYRIESQGQPLRSVTIPIVEEGVLFLSGITYIVDDQDQVKDQAESRLVLDGDGTYVVKTYKDGQLVGEYDTGTTDAQVRGESPDVVPYGFGEKAACVAATLGVSIWIANTIVGMCGTSCVAAETGVGAAICAACITGIVSIGGVSLTALYNCFTL